MKSFRLFLAVTALVVFTCTARAAEKAPAMPIEQALKLAQDYLKRNGAHSVVVGLTLEKPALLSSSQHWYAKWSVPVRRDGKPEVGLQIGMDGALTRVVGRGALKSP